MSIILGIIIIILVLANAVLISGVGYFIGYDKGRKEVTSKIGGLFSALISSVGDGGKHDGEDEDGEDKPKDESEAEDAEADISQTL